MEKKIRRDHPGHGHRPYPLSVMLRVHIPSSTKNKASRRNEEMRSTRKGNQSYFDMKMHMGMDDSLGLIYHIETAQANI